MNKKIQMLVASLGLVVTLGANVSYADEKAINSEKCGDHETYSEVEIDDVKVGTTLVVDDRIKVTVGEKKETVTVEALDENIVIAKVHVEREETDTEVCYGLEDGFIDMTGKLSKDDKGIDDLDIYYVKKGDTPNPPPVDPPITGDFTSMVVPMTLIGGAVSGLVLNNRKSRK